MSRRLATGCWPGVLVLACTAAFPQKIDPGREVYREVAKSVFVILARSGDMVAQGTGFLIAGGKIVTNNHVVSNGVPVIDLGAIKIPARVERVDSYNDLAILVVDAEVSATPLRLATSPPLPGETIYAVGNPEGLEKSISMGVVSAVRDVDGRKLIQVSSPISPGSSGGPIVNSSGEVVGVAVGMLKTGQNLNFAIPVQLVQRLLNEQADGKPDAVQTIQEVQSLEQKLKSTAYSADTNSEWQTLFSKIQQMWRQAFVQAGNDVSILEKIAISSGDNNTEVAIAAAERVLKARPSPEMNLLLATYLSSQSLFAEAAEKPKLLARAENSARTALKGMKQPTADAYFRLADILEDEGSYAESEVAFKRALDQSRASKDKGWEASSLRGLIRVSYALDHRSDGERWFEALRASGSANAFDYRSQAERLYKVASFLGSAHAYESAAVSSEGVWTDWCQAKLSYSLADSADDVLRAGRKCIELGSGQPDSEKELEWAHLSIAGVLNERGVYEEALSHSREAIALDSSDAFAYGNMADALYGLHRYQETINAAKQAIRLSDGKYAGMHFRLGAAYFETENWQFAKDSFEKAAQLEPKDDAAAYNVAVSLGRMGFYKDAASWYEEVLRRNPNHKDRDEITRTIQNFRR